MVVEFGLILPLLMILISALFEFGMVYSLRMSLTHAAREGVRVYSLVDGGDWETAARDSLQTGTHTVNVTTSGNCPTPSSPPSPPVQAFVETSITYDLAIAFLPAMSQTLTGRGVMRCGG